MPDCLASDLTSGRLPLPGGLIHRTALWRVEHCVGPFGVGALVVKPDRHVVHLAELTSDEAAEMGPLLTEAAAVITKLTNPEQVYVALWSHAGGVPVHVHFLLQPVTTEIMERFQARGSQLQMAQLQAGELPDPDEVDIFAARARDEFG